MNKEANQFFIPHAYARPPMATRVGFLRRIYRRIVGHRRGAVNVAKWRMDAARRKLRQS